MTAGAQANDQNVKIGVLTDLSSLYADLGGPGSILAAQMAVDAVILGLPHPPLPLRPTACSGYFPMAILIHASQVTQCNHDLVRTRVINPSRPGTRLSMLTLTSH